MLFHNYFKSRAVKALIVGAGKIAYYLLGILKTLIPGSSRSNPEKSSFLQQKEKVP